METPRFSRRQKGFTLIELIVVIAILAVLASVAVPGLISQLDNAKRSAARKTCTDIVQAVENFTRDNNGAMPYKVGRARADGKDQVHLETAGGKDADLIKILSNREEDDDNRINVAGDTYIRSDETENKNEGGLYVSKHGYVELYDPWGSPFYVIICEEDEGCIDPYTRKRLRGKHCIAYSLGPDKEGAPNKRGRKSDDDDTIEDNVYSWKSKSK